MAEATHISGDAALAQVVADLSKQLRWDPKTRWRAWWATSPRCAWWAGRAGWRAARCRPASARPRMCPNTWPRKAACCWPSGAGAMAPGPGRAGRARRGAGAVRRRSADETGRRWRKRAPDPCSPAAPATHHPGFPALRPGRAGAFQPEPPAGHLPAARHAAGHSSAPATRTAVAPGAGVAGPHLRQVRPGAVHPPRPDSGRYRQ